METPIHLELYCMKDEKGRDFIGAVYFREAQKLSKPQTVPLDQKGLDQLMARTLEICKIENLPPVEVEFKTDFHPAIRKSIEHSFEAYNTMIKKKFEK